jgi:hypothetical protein
VAGGAQVVVAGLNARRTARSKDLPMPRIGISLVLHAAWLRQP